MDMETQQAREALQAISQAETAVRRQSLNNGIIPLVWGMAVLTAMIAFDAALHLAPDSDIGILAAGLFLVAISTATGAWTSAYRRRLPVQPRTLDRPRLRFWWTLYHSGVVFGGMALAVAVAHSLHRHCAPTGTFALIGLADAAPLFWVGWQQRRACGRPR